LEIKNNMEIDVHLHVSLTKFLPEGAREKSVSVKLPNPANVIDIVHQLNIPERYVKLVFVNGVRSNKKAALSDGDRVSLFPPVGGG